VLRRVDHEEATAVQAFLRRLGLRRAPAQDEEVEETLQAAKAALKKSEEILAAHRAQTASDLAFANS
jgi:uncharacterized membrane-anchored protein YhcB (DUF1043 family)